MTSEKTRSPISGYLMLCFGILFVAGVIFFIVRAAMTENPWFMIPIFTTAVIGALILIGLFIVNPNDSRVLVLFGTYKGTVKANGLYWANPFYTKKKITLRARNLNGEKLKVNDKAGNPIEIAAVVVWQVEDTFKASFDVDDYEHYVIVQSEAAVRHLAGAYSYDTFEDDEQEEFTLRAGADQVNEVLEQELAERFDRAGIKVIEARLSHLAYAPEIAEAMLRRQQAKAGRRGADADRPWRGQHGGDGAGQTLREAGHHPGRGEKSGNGQQPAGRALQRVIRLAGRQHRYALPVGRTDGRA